ncbi:hypothetical protein [Arthrobacter sp.]|uniref:hypothetical protein n=1 Tax=Arthrobacter sp. TaxID=1667 RepID=UPI0026E0C796|nr:hypothetical protein [Arthrobacter sp.]MDO5753493.1 hypothetical protein [Arthrobacter sp.]
MKQPGHAGEPYPHVEVKTVDTIKGGCVSGGEEVSPTAVKQVLCVNVNAKDLVESGRGRLDHFEVWATFLFAARLPCTRLAKVSRARLRQVQSQANSAPSSAIPNAAERQLESAGCDEGSVAQRPGLPAPRIHALPPGTRPFTASSTRADLFPEAVFEEMMGLIERALAPAAQTTEPISGRGNDDESA